ncbi:MAG: glycosyltransferase family 4 protein [Steroidobacteraceae bacterium]
MLNVLQISFYLDPQGRAPEQLLTDWVSLVDVADAVAGAGARVSVIQACPTRALIRRGAVDYHFVPPSRPRRSIVQGSEFASLLRELKPDVLHVHGLGFADDLRELARLAPDIPVLLQDHGGALPRPWWRHRWRRSLSLAAGMAFTGTANADRYRRAGLIDARAKLFDVPESSSRFTPGDRGQARAECGLHGDPAVLWVGHLDRNKDPLTVLEGLGQAARELPGLQLWCCFGAAPLLEDVRQRIRLDAHLQDRVHLIGRVEHQRVQTLMRAADLFVLGSHREGSGYALIEALACGLPPVVTDIPSFRALTDAGRIGALWQPSDPQSLCAALIRIAGAPQGTQRADARRHFEREVSFDAVGRKLLAAYRAIRADAGIAAD